MDKDTVRILRYDTDEVSYMDDKHVYTMEIGKDGDMVDYAAIQHAYKECLDHGLSLGEAILLIEKVNGS